MIKKDQIFRILPVTFSILRPMTYPPRPISSKFQNSDVFSSKGIGINAPSRTINVNASMTMGRHDFCSQFPCASVRMIAACSFSNSEA